LEFAVKINHLTALMLDYVAVNETLIILIK